MGIKGLWTVLTPYSEKKSLHEIRGETLSIDLAGWVCDSQNVTDYYIQPKLYLRNLFFRTVYLILADIKPIFVLEGDAPELKRDVMAARNAIQFRGAAPRSEAAISNKRPDVGRKRFKGVLKEMVDAVVSQDSDCFAYGARRVYRNFSVSGAGGGGAMQGSVDCYDVQNMWDQNGFGRNKMVALALLCGCDYGVGACGLSMTTAVAFLHTVPDKDIIPRLVSWVSEPEHFEQQSRWLSVPGRCDRCGHGGRTHAKNGCPVCATSKACKDTGHKTKVADVKRELSLRKRAISCGAPFPEPRVMKEFLDRPPETVHLDHLKPGAPSLIQFMKIMTKKLDWSERYCVEKFLPLLTKFHLQDCVPNRTIKPIAIKKKRVPRGVPSYEVVWGDIDGQYDGLIPDDQFDDEEDPLSAWTTIERQDLMRKYYVQLVEEFEESIKKPVKEKKTRSKKNKEDNKEEKPKRKYNRKPKPVAVDNIAQSTAVKNYTNTADVQNTSKLNVSVKINKLKRKQKTLKSKNQKTIESFLLNKKRRLSKKLINSLRDSFQNISLQKVDESNNVASNYVENKENIIMNNSLLNLSNDEINDSDLSDIVDKIVSKAPCTKTATVNNNLVKLVFEQKYSTPRKSEFRKSVLNNIHKNCSTPNDSPKRRSSLYHVNISNNSFRAKVNTSYFFDKLTDDCDAFEMSVDYNRDYVNVDADRTVNYSLHNSSL